jgi:thiamine-phosphate pyrophosphorylase
MGGLPTPTLCLVTDRAARREAALEAAVVAAVQGGVDMVQLRKKDLPGRALLEVGQRLKQAIDGRALLIINERVDVAQACDADGVQLGEDGLPVPVVRRLLGEGKLIGRSVHSVEAAMQAESEGADFLIVGTIFTTGSHPGAKPAGVELLARVAQQIKVPFLGIGGITAENVSDVMRAGASGAALISAILSSPSPQESAADIKKRMTLAPKRAPASASRIRNGS